LLSLTIAGALAGAVLGSASCAMRVKQPYENTSWARSSKGWKPNAEYPQAARAPIVEDFFGTPVADPYRWMEDMDSDQTHGWIEDQNALTMPFLQRLPRRNAIEKRLTELYEYERYSAPSKVGERFFYTYNPGLADHDVVYVADSLDSEGRVLIDPNTFSKDGTVSLAGTEASPDGSLVAYAKSDGGSDWRDWFIRDVETGKDLDDHITFTKFTGISWLPDASGFYYSRYPEGEGGHGDDSRQVAIYYHAVGTAQSEDQRVYDATEMPKHRDLAPDVYGEVTEDGRYLVVTVQAGYHENQVHVLDLREPAAEPVRLIGEWEALFSFLGNEGTKLFFETTLGAPNSRVISIDMDSPERTNWREVVPEADEALQTSSYVGGHLIAQYLKDAQSLVKVFDTEGQHVRDVDLPGIGSAGGFGGRGDDPTTSYTFTSFTTPSESYIYNVETGESSLFRRPDVAIDLDDYEVKQVFYPSNDGTQVPMFIVHKNGVKLSGTNPTLLYGYGGFNVSLTPGYSTSRMVWMEMGGVLAIPNIRGGGEYGKEWHLAGTKANKQNVFDDFIAAAEWLIANQYTNPQRLAIQGGSNGGLLVGACMTQRPELFGACLPAVGVLDMIRYHTASANARNWSTDYGLSEVEEEFQAQIAYSPYHNVTEGECYPPTLITTADHDDRVVPWHSYKFAAELQHAQSCPNNPVLIRVETRAGHGAGTAITKRIQITADQWAFLVWAIRM
jgi:prolyl oligopeptidase